MPKYVQLPDNVEQETKVKKVGFCSNCCSLCCLGTSCTAMIFLSIFAILLATNTYFEASYRLPEIDKNEYTLKAKMFGCGVGFEAIIFILSLIWVISNQKKKQM